MGNLGAKSGAKSARGRSAQKGRKWPLVAVALVAIGGAAMLLYGKPIRAYARTGASYGAHMTCSCRFIAGREMGDCKKDFEPGMEFVFVSEDTDDKSVTAYIPFIASETATYRDGPGCVLEKWDG